MSLLRKILLHRQTLRLTLPSTSSTLSILPPRATPPYHQRYYPDLIHSHLKFYSSVSPNHLQAENPTSPPIPIPSRHPFTSETLLITDAGKTRLKKVVNSTDGTYLRVFVEGGGCSGFQYKFEIDSRKLEDDDVVLTEEPDNDKQPESRVVVDKTSLEILKGSTIDYETELIRSAFRIINIPLAEQGCSCGASFNVKID